MTVTNADLIAPGGLLMAEMFPVNGATLSTWVDGWIAKATTAAATVDASDQDAAITAWVYWRGFNQAANELASRPTSVKSGDQSATWAGSQIQRLEGYAGQWKAEFDAYASTPSITVPMSVQASVVRNW